MLLRVRRLDAAARVVLRAMSSGSTREWKMLPSGARWCELETGTSNAYQVVADNVVRVEYVVRLDDGAVAANGKLSFRLGSRNPAVCAAVEEAVLGMRLGDRRRLRAPPHSSRGSSLSAA